MQGDFFDRWWGRRDLNPRPIGYEPTALTTELQPHSQSDDTGFALRGSSGIIHAMSTEALATRGGSFFSGSPVRIFSAEDFTGDDALMIRTAEDFSRKEVLTIQERLDTQEDGLMRGLMTKAGELGFCGPDTSEKYGGLGLPKNLSARMLEMLSLNASFSVTIGVSSGISQVGLNLFGNEAQKRKYLPKLATGEHIGAYALSEPNSGSDALSLTTRADEKGDKYILNGTKMWISNAKWADQFLVMAKVGGEKITAFIVERDFPGVSIAREERKMGLKGSSTARVLLENAEVPAENILHEIGQGHKVALNALNLGRFKLSAMSIGPAREAIRVAAEYAQDRRQFGVPISTFGLIEKKFADMAAWFYAAESMIYRAGADIDSAFLSLGGSPEGNRLAAEEFAVECSACKVLATELEARIVDEALQVYGGYGFTEEFPVARIYRDARISRIYEGTNEINRIFMADRHVRRATEGKTSLAARTDSFISDLCGKAFAAFVETYGTDGFGKKVAQIHLGALSDLLALNYAEQSCRLRAKQTGGINGQLAAHFTNWANVEAARAYQIAIGESVTLPEWTKVEVAGIAAAVYDRKTPIVTG